MSDFRIEVAEHFIGKKYEEEEIIAYLKIKGFTNIVPGAYPGVKRMNMKQKQADLTLFFTVDPSDKIENTRVEFKKLETIPNDAAVFFGCLSLVIVAICLVVWFFVWAFNDPVYDSGDDEETPSYEVNPDDYDGDGDVDIDDGVQYLEDSLEEDKNDGDDW
ncbi:hypothetical protein ACFQ4X_07060 [Fictibacillus halophilus]|uniref:hypothetical protein n=1 Tax=Fictibacillus halophilus TaxID=1610490 RepID=UPI003640929A